MSRQATSETRRAEPEQRRHPRTTVGRVIEYQHDDRTLEGIVDELSEGGARLSTVQPLAPSARIRLRLPLDDWRGSPDACEVEAVVLRSNGADAAVAFPARLLPRHRLLLRDFVWRGSR